MINEKPRTAGQVLLIPNDQIYPNPNQPRQVFDQEELVNLAKKFATNENVKVYEFPYREYKNRSDKL